MNKRAMNRRISVAGFGLTVAGIIFGTSAQSAQPVQVLTLDQLDQMDKAAASSTVPRATKHHRHTRPDAPAGVSKSAAQPVDARKDESGDLIAKLARDTSVEGRREPSRRGKMVALSSGVAAGFYRVNSGDTLARIATAFGQNPMDLMSWNNLTPNSLIQPGKVLRVGPPAGAHRSGMTG